MFKKKKENKEETIQGETIETHGKVKEQAAKELEQDLLYYASNYRGVPISMDEAAFLLFGIFNELKRNNELLAAIIELQEK